MIVKIRISDIAPLSLGPLTARRLFYLFKKKLAEKGYTRLDGAGMKSFDGINRELLYTYEPGRRDILFKRFDKRIPPWQKRKEILFRRF